jgi:hypothetical protein
MKRKKTKRILGSLSHTSPRSIFFKLKLSTARKSLTAFLEEIKDTIFKVYSEVSSSDPSGEGVKINTSKRRSSGLRQVPWNCDFVLINAEFYSSERYFYGLSSIFFILIKFKSRI